MNKDHQILLFYKYISIEAPEQLATQQRVLCEQLGLTGRLIIAHEGINGTFEGTYENTEKYVAAMQQDPRFSDIHFKRSPGTGNAFPKLSIKVRDEIVSAHLNGEDFSPQEITGKYITAEELHDLIHSDQEFYIIDMRNDYEHKVGHFAHSILPPLTNFRDLPAILPTLEHLRNKKIVTVCTGGVRCEKASGFLVKHGFTDVSQLYGGIVTYMEKYPNEDFKGLLYVFDGRITMGFNVEAPEHEVIGKCEKCGEASEQYIDCAYIHCQGHRHILCCTNCQEEDGKAYCSERCKLADIIKVGVPN
jgi:UPF0176 protein